MGCDPARHAQDDWLFTSSAPSRSIVLDGDNVTLTVRRHRNGDARHVRSRSLTALSAQTWTLNSIISGDAVSSVPAGVTATIQFNEDGTVQFQSGCNSGGGSYTVDGQIDRLQRPGHDRDGVARTAERVEDGIRGGLSADSVDFVDRLRNSADPARRRQRPAVHPRADPSGSRRSGRTRGVAPAMTE